MLCCIEARVIEHLDHNKAEMTECLDRIECKSREWFAKLERLMGDVQVMQNEFRLAHSSSSVGRHGGASGDTKT